MRGNGAQTARLIPLQQIYQDEGILPYTRKLDLPQSSQITLTATPGEYESGSFILQTGKTALKNVSITASNLTTNDKKQTINNARIDIRLVKAWFQSAKTMRRTNRNRPKILTPELLLHDNKLVKVDFDTQTNAIRHNPGINDAKTLLPFNVPAHFNQQVWVTIHVPDSTPAGTYHGTLTVKSEPDNKNNFDKNIKIQLTVLPFKLANTRLFMGQFYLAWLTKPVKTYYNARGKNTQQMLAELIDMKQHGVNQITIDHNYHNDPQAITLSRQIALVKQAGLTTNSIIYVDWQVNGQNNPYRYRKKLQTIQQAFTEQGIGQFWIYNKDEKKLNELVRSSHTFDAAHEIGAKNIVAVTNPQIALQLGNHLDYVLVQHKTPTKTISKLKSKGVTPIAYGLPHAGEEKPATTRYTYGFGLVEKGFAGTLSYAYQSGETWDDWMHWEKSNYRPNVMAYPTANAPIPTLQWEAWREAVDDLKYLETLVKQTGSDLKETLEKAIQNTGREPDKIRLYLIKQILATQKQ